MTQEQKKKDIVQALQLLQAALADYYGDAGECARQGDGCDIDIRASGIDLLGKDCSYEVQDGSPEAVAEQLVS